MNATTINKLRQLDAEQNWHEVFRFRNELSSILHQTDKTANLLLMLIAKHWRFCNKKNCRHRALYNRKTIINLYQLLILKQPKNVRLKIDEIYFKYGKNSKKYIDEIKKIIKKTNKREFTVMIGHAYSRMGKHNLARKYLLSAVPYIKGHYGIYYALAKNARILADEKKEIEYSKKALKLFKAMPQKYHRDPVTKKFVNELREIIKKPR